MRSIANANAAQPATLNFSLRLQLRDSQHPWHAVLRSDSGEQLDFTTLLELTRHLAGLCAAPPRPGGLR